MNDSVAKTPAGTSPRMVFLSAVLHALGILAIILFSSSLFNKPKPITLPKKVRIVSPLTAPVVEPLAIPEHAPSEPKESQPTLASVPRIDKPPNRPRPTISSRKAKISTDKKIKLKKRKKQLKKVAEPRKPEQKKPPEKKRENPEKYLAQKMDDLKKRVNENKKNTPHPQLSGTQPRPGTLMDAETVRWLDDVKNLINANWSVLRENRGTERETVIGVIIAEDGRLNGASVDRPSGDRYLDQLAMRAVHQAAPFPPVPKLMMARIRAAGGLALRFSTKGVR
jgi:periplasmic protein TonB